MNTQKRYSPGVRERAVRMVLDHQAEHALQWAAIGSIGAKIGCTPETLRRWVRQAERDRIGACMRTCVKLVLFAAVAMLAGSTVTPTREAAAIRVVGAGMVTGCRYLGDVSGSSSVDGIAQSVGVKNAKTAALEQAAKWGAKAVV